ncbi:MAG: hypothetical protein ABI461_18800 [Polyangiaceae bacterium]
MRFLSRRFLGLGVLGAAVLFSGSALAQDPNDSGNAPPSAERIRSAAAEYDAGRRAFMENKYEEAAIHFENAFHDAPRAEALRNAIRARKDAKQFARAATLAALAERAYADDANTMVVVHDTLSDAAPKLERISLDCSPKCGVASDGRVLSLDDVSHFVFFLDPGEHDVVVSWEGDRTKQVKVAAKAGGRLEWKLDAPLAAPVAPPPVAVQPPPPVKEQLQAKSKPFGPVIFFIGAGLTVVGAGATVLSGIDTQNNPGAAAVQKDCAGQGESCPEYQEGRSKQLRTNILLGSTIGVGVLTGVVGVFFTQWSHPHPVATGSIQPYFGGDSRSAAAGLRGSF